MTKTISRRDQEHQEHIRHILDAAESIFAEQGFFKTTMRQIALKAEFALGTIYSHFGNKKQLYGKVVERKVNELVAFVTEEMADVPSVQDQAEKFIQAKMTFLHNNLPFLRLYLAEVDVPRLDINHILPEEVHDKYDSILCLLTGVIWQGMKEGLFKPMDARVIVKAIDGLTNALALSWLSSADAHLSFEADIRDVTELFLRGALIRQESTLTPGNGEEPNNGS